MFHISYLVNLVEALEVVNVGLSRFKNKGKCVVWSDFLNRF